MERVQANPTEPEAPRQVGLGTHVEVELIDQAGNSERMAFDLVRDHLADIDRGLLGESTPLAKAIRGKFVGSVASYRMGDICQVRIVQVVPTQAPTTVNTAEQRAEVLKKAREDAERTNAEMFAASFSGKWGDYQMAERRAETGDAKDKA